ncbi:MAG: response regulator transcription factor [Clostridia bacterium]|nr:response regulator transcription factor [Clostridia bacterium]
MASNIRSKLLIIEDDPGICAFLRATLAAEGYDVLLASTGQSALQIISSHCPDCILLDLGLPDMDGAEIIRSVRGWTPTPIVVISARSMEQDKAEALDLGADDYITKPFGAIELLARIRAALRHTRTTAESDEIALTGSYHVDGLEIDYKRHRVYLNGEDVHLTPNEFRIISLLGMHPGRVMTYKSILRALWGPAASMDNKILRVHMASIRRKIEPNPNEPRYIFTEVGVGYRMAEETEMKTACDPASSPLENGI